VRLRWIICDCELIDQLVNSPVCRGKFTDVKRVAAVKPFQLCYNGAFPLLKRPVSYDVPAIDLKLAGATRNWTVFNNNYLVQVDGTMCVGILEMGSGGMRRAGSGDRREDAGEQPAGVRSGERGAGVQHAVGLSVDELLQL
jgi:hypothetical protein